MHTLHLYNGCKNYINQEQMLSDCTIKSVLSGEITKMNKMNQTLEELNSNWRWETMSRLFNLFYW